MPQAENFATPQHQAAEAVAEALEADAQFLEVELYKGSAFSLITAFMKPASGRLTKLRIEVHPEKI